MKLSIIIPNYNTQDYLKRCLQSIKQSKDKLRKEIIVVDNASNDQSVVLVKRYFPQVKLIESPQNLGYAAGSNLGLKQAKGEYILLLNSDTEVLPKTLDTMVKFMDTHPGVGVSTCRVELPTGQLDPACHRGFPTPWAATTYFLGLEKIFPQSQLFGQYHQGWKDLSQVHQIDTPAGAFYLTRKRILDQVGLLDERFFIYAEDIDLSMRIKQAGWKIVFIPTVKIIHYKKTSGLAATDQSIRLQTSKHFFDTMKLFYDKHYRGRYPAVIRWMTLLGIWLVSKLRN